jgi:hypothetical protein
MFLEASSFNLILNEWNVSAVTDMLAMFYEAQSFIQPRNEWNVGAVIEITGIFYEATSFNQDICSWGQIPTIPWTSSVSMFLGSGCIITASPMQDKTGPFCASDCSVRSNS